MDWQPIETAPKDGSIIILTDGKTVEVGCWSLDLHGKEYPWSFVDDYRAQDIRSDGVGVSVNGWEETAVTHWMHLPKPPVRP